MWRKILNSKGIEKGEFTFFTDIISTQINNYAVVPINRYNSKKKLTRKMILIDPRILWLLNHDEYKDIDKLHALASGKEKLRKNEWISIDYSCGVRPEKWKECIKKSEINNWKYKDNSKYICAIQFRPNSIKSFENAVKRLEPIWKDNPEKIVGIGGFGNLSDHFLKNLFNTVRFSLTLRKVKLLHFYGLGLEYIKNYISKLLIKDFKISIDSTKWFFGGLQTCYDKFRHLPEDKRPKRSSPQFQKEIDSRYREYMINIQKGIHHKVIW